MIDFQTFKNYTQKLYQIDSEFDAMQTDRLTRHRHLETESAQFLASFVMGKNAKSILEIGTSTGYSTLWLAYALSQMSEKEQSQANFISMDIEHARLETAKTHLQNLGLDKVVKLKQADAKDYLAEHDVPFNMIFLDAERKFYRDYVTDLKRLMMFQSVLVVDNVISHANEVTDFLAEFEKDDSYLCTTLPIGAGLFLAVKQQ